MQSQAACSRVGRLVACAVVAIGGVGSSLMADGSVECWGAGTSNTGVFPQYGQSVLPSGLATCSAISGGWMHSMALRADGTVAAWGANTNNLGTVVNQSVVPAGTGTCIGVAAGFYHSAALRATGSVVAWGDNRYNQTAVPGTLGVCTKIAAGGYHTLVIRNTGLVAAWGAGVVNGGVIPDLGQSAVPAGLGTCTQIAGGGYHSVAIRTDGAVMAWGSNSHGQTTIPAGLGVCTQVACGDVHTVALKSTGTVVCFGGGTTATNTNLNHGQSIVPAGLGVCTQIGAGGYHTLAVKSDGSIACWGATSTALGVDPNIGQSNPPSPLTQPNTTLLVAGGGRHSMAITRNRYVPSQYATIQAAINAAVAGDRIVVAAGTFNQAFALNGKNVIVTGAANNATVIDGTGQTTSIVRFTGGEPATAGIENLVLRNGTAGSLITPTSTFTVGGAVFGTATAAFIRNCRFEDCRADYGGGVYELNSTILVENCVYFRNSALVDGGGSLVYQCTGNINACTFTLNRSGTAGAGSGSAFKSAGARVAGQSVTLNGCTVTQNTAVVSGSAVEHYENIEAVSGILRLVGTSITANLSGKAVPTGAAGLRVLGAQPSCVLSGGTTICSNTPRQTSGPFLISGSATVCGCQSDFTGDGQVNAADLAALLGAWGSTSPTGVGDANHDGIVNAADIGALLSGWGACTN